MPEAAGGSSDEMRGGSPVDQVSQAAHVPAGVTLELLVCLSI